MLRRNIDAEFDELHGPMLREEANRALAWGSGYAGGLAAVAALSLPAVMLVDLAQGLWGPWIFTLVALVACGLLNGLARRRQVWGQLAWVVVLVFVSMPTFFFLLTHLVLPGGAATFLNGPFSYLYLVLIVVSGCLFRFRLSVASGLVAAGGYLLCFALAHDVLSELEHPNPGVLQDLVAPPIYVFRALMMVAAGFVVGGLAVVAKRLTLRIAEETRSKAEVSRLFGEYVSEEVREKLLNDPLPVGGEEKEVVVLFSDIRGFTTMSEAMDAATLVTRLNEYFDAMVRPISVEGGVVDKLIGDAIMATFGGVLEIDDPAGAAVRAARGMRAALADLNASWATEGIASVESGVGVHVGPVVLGSIGSEHRKDFTVIGDAVNTASRVEGLTKDYEPNVLITAAVYERLGDAERVWCTELGETRVKGRASAVALLGVADP